MPEKISIIIPAFNEEERLGNSLQVIMDYFRDKPFETEIVVVDDGSSDSTVKIAGEFPEVKVIPQPRNMGKGAAVRRGMLESTGGLRIFTDADLSTPIYETTKIIDKIREGFDIVAGSRAVDYGMIRKHQPFYREFMGKTFNQIVQLLVIRGIKDTQCGFKGFTARAAETIFSKAKIDGFSFDVEALFLGKKAGFKIAEVPVEWYNDERSKVNPVWDSLNMFREILRIKSLHKDTRF
jgi:dolichyl-phosphate beta-glucosyltransferase